MKEKSLVQKSVDCGMCIVREFFKVSPYPPNTRLFSSPKTIREEAERARLIYFSLVILKDELLLPRLPNQHPRLAQQKVGGSLLSYTFPLLSI